ncbi:MAG: hypothetical protein CVU43_21655 [Chloroflexi bacterium HGW-Chloroflexi-5]|nr:MAG: hypothetical protein CVU43_21655 [Chloroflexi bacterium HGW-Chloroflexi-5]
MVLDKLHQNTKRWFQYLQIFSTALAILRTLSLSKVMEIKDWQFPITSFHNGLQKVEGLVERFTEIIKEITIDGCSYVNGKSSGK